MDIIHQALNWSEADLQRLLGQPESYRLEFKSGRLFQASRDKVIETLSKEVSAFANAEGGLVVVGLSDRKEGKSYVAAAIDGIDPDEISVQALQQAVEASVSPVVPGLRFRTVPLAGEPRRVCIVVAVPAGTTAHQANDKRYYGRSEFEAKPLADHDVRLRMQRGRVRRARVEVSRWLSKTHSRTSDGATAIVDWNQGPAGRLAQIEELDELGNQMDEVQSRASMIQDVVAFAVRVANEGELTIRDLSVELGFKRDTHAVLFIGPDQADVEIPLPYRWDLPRRLRLHPEQRVELRMPILTTLLFGTAEKLARGDAVLTWTVYVEDGMPTRGEIDLADEIGSPLPDA
jgi:hypothetical protein